MDAASDFAEDGRACSRIDAEGLLDDINRMVAYASRAGLMHDRTILAPIEAANQSLLGKSTPDACVLAPIMSTLAVLIAPMTLVDLRENRDPFMPKNQKRAGLMQIVMTVCSLLMLAVIVASMHYLRVEKETLERLAELDAVMPAQRLTELRRIAQEELPAAREDSMRLLNEKYYAKRAEYLQLNRKVVSSTFDIQTVAVYPVVPLIPSLPNFRVQEAVARPPEVNQGSVVAGGSASGSSGGAADLEYAQDDYVCSEKDGRIALPPVTYNYPKWLKEVLMDAMTDYCFQVAVSNAGLNSPAQVDPPDSLTFGREIRDHMTWRTLWVLPLTLGFLGAMIFMMQNVSNVRVPAVEWHGLAMRIAMGGIAGVAVGWFIGGDSIKLSESSPITVALALSFLTGYSIDIFFQALARLSAGVTESLSRPAVKNAS